MKQINVSVPENFVIAMRKYAEQDKQFEEGSIRSIFKHKEAWSNLQKELLAWVRFELDVKEDLLNIEKEEEL